MKKYEKDDAVKILSEFKKCFPTTWVKGGVEFNGDETCVLWAGEISQIDGIPAFNYYSFESDPKEKIYVMGVHKKLVAFAEAHGIFWECHDPGTWVAYRI